MMRCSRRSPAANGGRTRIRESAPASPSTAADGTFDSLSEDSRRKHGGDWLRGPTCWACVHATRPGTGAQPTVWRSSVPALRRRRPPPARRAPPRAPRCARRRPRRRFCRRSSPGFSESPATGSNTDSVRGPGASEPSPQSPRQRCPAEGACARRSSQGRPRSFSGVCRALATEAELSFDLNPAHALERGRLDRSRGDHGRARSAAGVRRRSARCAAAISFASP